VDTTDIAAPDSCGEAEIKTVAMRIASPSSSNGITHPDGAFRCGLEISIGEYDVGRLATKFECERQNAFGREATEFLASPETAGERNLAYRRLGNHRWANLATRADNDVEDAIGHTCLGRNLRQLDNEQGVCSDGLATTVLPIASAGAIARAA
jgi:hypothetical protein